MVSKVYDDVKLHTRQKHAFIEAYYRIWTQNVGANKGPDAPTLSIVDLYAGTGMCRDQESGEQWSGSALLSAECLNHYPSRHKCSLFLNSYTPEGEKAQQVQRRALEARVNEIGLHPRHRPVAFTSLPISEAVPEALGAVNLNYPNVWVLDPYKPQHLPWSIVNQIASQTGPEYERRPELIVTLMTYLLQKSIDTKPELITQALGVEEDEWRKRIDNLRDGGLNVREAIRTLYAERLMEIYGKPPWWIEVDGVEGNIVYVVFFCSDNPAAYYSMKKIALTKFAEWRLKKYTPKAKKVAAGRKVDRRAGAAGHRQLRLGEDS